MVQAQARPIPGTHFDWSVRTIRDLHAHTNEISFYIKRDHWIQWQTPQSQRGQPGTCGCPWNFSRTSVRALDNAVTQAFVWGPKCSSVVWSKELLNFLISEVAAGKDISCKDYPESALDVQYALELLGVGQQDRLLVGGSISPWVEAVALHLGVGEVTTVDYSVPQCDNCHPRLDAQEYVGGRIFAHCELLLY